MKINKFIFLATLCSVVSIVANGPVGDIIFNNDTGWNLSIKYKIKNNPTIQEIKMVPDQAGTELPIGGLESLTIEAVASMFTLSKKPTANDGKKILSVINNNKARLTGKDTIEVNLDVKDNAIDAGVKISDSKKGLMSLPEGDMSGSGSVSAPKTVPSSGASPLPYDLLLNESYVKQRISKADFDAFIARIPERYRMRIVQRAVAHLAKDESKAKKLSEEELFGILNTFFKDKQGSYRTPLALIGTAYGIDNFVDPLNKGYMQFVSEDLMKGPRKDQNIQKYDKPLLQMYVNHLDGGRKQEAESLIPIMLDSYKIHLMPLKDDLLAVLIQLIETIQNSPTLQNKIASFKIAPEIPYKHAANKEPHIGQNAVVVIYPAEGKNNTQDVLNALYNLFKGTKGMNVRPRYNARVNDLIWVAQGDGQVKEGDTWSPYYDKDGLYYKPEAFGKPANLDLKLKHPATGKDLVEIK